MKKLALALALAGIFILLLILNLSSPIKITNSSDLSELPENTKVRTTGKVVSEKLYSDLRIITLDTGIQVTCTDCPSYHNKTLEVTGVVEAYINRTQIAALSLSTPD